MSFSSLSIGASALYAAQRASEIAANNVANANTPGYTRQRLDITNAPPTPGTPGVRGDGMRGNGVSVVGIQRMRDTLADLSYRAEAGTSAAADARSDVLNRAQGVLGAYPEGASASLDRFFSSWQKLNLTPQDPAARANVLDSGQQLASALDDASAQLDQISSDTSTRMQDAVTEVNSLARHVAQLNQSIADAVTGQQSPNDLMDQRDVALDRLAALTGSTVRDIGNGQVDVSVGNSPLVQGVTTRTMTATRTGTTAGVAFTDGPAVVGGQLGAYARAIAVDVPAFHAQLDQVASQLAAQVNAVHSAAYSLDSPGGTPPPPPDGGDFFTGTTAGTIAVRAGLTPNGIAASSSGAPTDGNAALGVFALSSAGSPSVGALLRGAASQLGAAAADATRNAATAQSGLTGADQRRAAADGVNTNEEMVDLVKYQHTYEAAARVISMADGFIDTIINHMGAGR